jgi:hypothetical protein
MAKIIGVYKARGGSVARFWRAVGRLLGAYSCDLARITHGRSGEKKQWREMRTRLAADSGYQHLLVLPDRAPAAYQAASSGREPCVLIEDDEGSLSMILDWNDLAVAHGDIAKYEQILRSKLLMY